MNIPRVKSQILRKIKSSTFSNQVGEWFYLAVSVKDIDEPKKKWIKQFVRYLDDKPSEEDMKEAVTKILAP